MGVHLKCVRCGNAIDEGAVIISSHPILHPLCPDCLESLATSLTTVRKIIDSVDRPIVVIQEDGTIVANNRSLQKHSHSPHPDFRGRQPGDVIECAYAKLPEGCGNTVHCKGCAIRKAINKTAQEEVGVYHERAYQYIKTPVGLKYTEYMVSTEKVGKHILLQIDQL